MRKKVEKGGEDAFFVSNYNGGVIAVADGVSGWAEQNVDPALFSRELMANASSLVGDEEYPNEPLALTKSVPSVLTTKGNLSSQAFATGLLGCHYV